MKTKVKGPSGGCSGDPFTACARVDQLPRTIVHHSPKMPRIFLAEWSTTATVVMPPAALAAEMLASPVGIHPRIDWPHALPSLVAADASVATVPYFTSV